MAISFFNRSKVKSEKRNKLSHMLAALIIMINGCERLNTQHSSSAKYFLAAGVLFFLIAVFHRRLLKYIRSADAIFSFIEAAIAVVIAVDYFNDHKHYIQYAYLLVAIIYFIRSFILFNKAGKNTTAR